MSPSASSATANAFTPGVDSTAMPHGLQRIDAGHDHVTAALAVQRHDQTDAAGVQLLRGVVAVGVGELRGAALWEPAVAALAARAGPRPTPSRRQAHGAEAPRAAARSTAGTCAKGA